jgi:NADH dehydrogenase
MMDQEGIHAVTGAFGFSGKYITRQLLAAGKQVITLTNSMHRSNEFSGRIGVFPYNFDSPGRLVESLKGVEVLYNTYWVRFNHSTFRHSEAVKNTLTLFEAAQQAGVRRVVHTSITNPDEHSPLEYFSGKGVLEKALMQSGMGYSIVRPAVLFGDEDILINNIAWMIRHFPVFGTFGNGAYRLQPIFVEDYATLSVKHGAATENKIVDAIGPETFTYCELVRSISQIVLGKARPVFAIPDELGYWVSKLVGLLKQDKLITREEIKGLKANLLCTDSPAAGSVKLTDWLRAHKDTVGVQYANELKRRIDNRGMVHGA